MKILISVPNTGWNHKLVTVVLLKLQLDKRYLLTFIFPTHVPYENNLHHIVKDFIAGGYDFWLNIDADNPPKNNPLDLVELNRDIIGLPTPIWHWTGRKKGERPIYWNAYDYVAEKNAFKEHLPQKGLQKVDAVGTGCFLISKRVFLNENMQTGVFSRLLYPDGIVEKGNDISFCERATREGFEISVHYDYPCMHFQELELTEVIQAFQEVTNG